MSSGMTLKALHDRLLAEKPEGAVHDSNGCPLCAMTEDDGGTDEGGRSVSENTYTEAELAAAVEAALAPVQARIKELETSQQVSEHEAALAALRTEKDAEIDALQKELDEAVARVEVERTRADSIVAWLEGEAAAAAERDALEARRDERVSRVRDVASLPEEYLAKHADRFAAMDEEDFAAHLEGLKEIAEAAGTAKPATDTLPTQTGLHAARDTTTEGAPVSAVKTLLAARRDRGRVDFSTL